MSNHDETIRRALRPRGPIDLRLARHEREDLTLLEVEGELDLLTVTRLAAELDDEIRRGQVDVVLDLRRLAFIDSSGLHVLLNARRRLARHRRLLGIVCGPGPVRRTFELARLVQTLDVTTSLGDFKARRAASERRGPVASADDAA